MPHYTAGDVTNYNGEQDAYGASLSRSGVAADPFSTAADRAAAGAPMRSSVKIEFDAEAAIDKMLANHAAKVAANPLYGSNPCEEKAR